MPDLGGGDGDADRRFDAFVGADSTRDASRLPRIGEVGYRSDVGQVVTLSASGRSIRLFTAPGGTDPLPTLTGQDDSATSFDVFEDR